MNAYEDRGFCHLRMGHHKEAIDDFNKFFEHNEGNKDAYFARGEAHFMMGNYD